MPERAKKESVNACVEKKGLPFAVPCKKQLTDGRVKCQLKGWV
jgi:hypothetical protein